jgi:hypothetical protein
MTSTALSHFECNGMSTKGFVVAKYSFQGSMLWSHMVCEGNDGSGDGSPSQPALSAGSHCVSENGDIFFTSCPGSSIDNHTHQGGGDVYLAKLDSSGTKQWSFQYGSSGTDIPMKTLCDSNGDVIVIGYTDTAITMGTGSGNVYLGGDYDCFATKFSSNGTELWSKMWGSDEFDVCNGAALDSSDNIYITGSTKGNFNGATYTGGTLLAAIVMKLTPQGIALSTELYHSDNGHDMSGNSIIVDAENSVYLGGFAGGSGLDGIEIVGNRDGFVRKVLSDGTWQWTKMVTGGSTSNIIRNLAFDEDGNVWFAGFVSGQACTDGTCQYYGGYDAVVGKLSGSTGTLTWDLYAPPPAP